MEQPREHLREILVDPGKGLVKLRPRNLVDFLDCLLSVLDRFHQISALRLKEAVAIRRFLVFFQRHHVYRAHLLNSLLRGPASLFFHAQFFSCNPHNLRIGAQSCSLDIDLGQAACFKVLQV